MASISAFGYLPLSPAQSTALTGASSATRCRTTVAARLADQTDNVSPLRSSGGNCGCDVISGEFDRRKLLVSSIGLLIGALAYDCKDGAFAAASQFADMPAIRGKDYGKTKMKYPDYTETPSGLQYKDLRLGTGPIPKKREKVVVDWDGYTIGYYGLIFEARNKTKGGSFEEISSSTPRLIPGSTSTQTSTRSQSLRKGHMLLLF